MSFHAKKGRVYSKDVTALRAEYEAKARGMSERKFNNATEKDKARAEKTAAFEKLKDCQVQERRDRLSQVHGVLISQGKLKSKEQMRAEREQMQAEAERKAAVRAERSGVSV